MSTHKLGVYFRSLGHEIAVYSFACGGHMPCHFGKLLHPEDAGAELNSANLDHFAGTLQDFRPDIVINQMPYEHQISDVLQAHKDFLLVGCLRNTLFSVKQNLPSYVRSVAPGVLKELSTNPLVQRLLLLLHRRRHRRDLRQILAIYDKFVMFGPPNIDELNFFLGDYDPDRIALIPNSIPAVAETLPAKEPRLLWVGRVAVEQKRVDLIPEVWARVHEALPEWELDIVGDGPDAPALKARIASLGLPRVNFHGQQPSESYYERSAIFFMTSSFEGFPNTLVEAQSMGSVPVIFRSYPVAEWIIEQGVNGRLIEPFDIDAMSQAIIDVAVDAATRGRLANEALRSARRFEVSRVGKRWMALFDQHFQSSEREAMSVQN